MAAVKAPPHTASVRRGRSARRRRAAVPAAALALAAALTAGAAAAEPDAPRASAAPTTAPSGDAPRGLLKLTPREIGWWQHSQANRGELAEGILPLLLSRVAALEPLSDEQLRELDRPSYKNLLADPERYARLPVRPIRMSVRVVRVYRLSPSEGTAPASEHWPRDKPFWRLQCLNANTNRPDLQPIIVFATADPMPLLPQGEPTKDDQGTPCVQYQAEAPYHDLPGLEIAGVFHKIYWGETSQGREQDYPIILAWDLRPKGPVGADTNLARYAIFLLIIVVAAALWWYLRRGIKRGGDDRGRGGRIYRPLRDRPRPDEPAAAEAAEEEAPDVDADLRAAVDDFKHREKDKHEGDDKG
jgi:hypothetical protein